MSSRSFTSQRSVAFSEDPHPRFWWHHLPNTGYVPAIYATLTDDEWRVMEQWYESTLERDSIGEINVPAMSLIQGFINGGALRRIVQLGHYYGYSSLLIGFWLQRMAQGGKLASIDIDPVATEFTADWIRHANLREQVDLYLGDSASEAAFDHSVEVLGGLPELIILDSSHQYDHTLRELELWVPRMAPQSIMLLHDTSSYARQWDKNGKGGVQQALDDWLPGRDDVAFMSLNRRVGERDVPEAAVYRDGCGLGILQKL